MKPPPRLKKKPRRTSAIRCPGHTADIKLYDCALKSKIKPTDAHHECWGPIDPHHTKTRGAGGGDDTLVPLCRGHHDLVHTKGLAWIEAASGVDLREMAALLWDISTPAKRYRLKHGLGLIVDKTL